MDRFFSFICCSSRKEDEVVGIVNKPMPRKVDFRILNNFDMIDEELMLGFTGIKFNSLLLELGISTKSKLVPY